MCRLLRAVWVVGAGILLALVAAAADETEPGGPEPAKGGEGSEPGVRAVAPASTHGYIRRREVLAFRAEEGRDQRLHCTMTGSVAGMALDADAEFMTHVNTVDDEGVGCLSVMMGDGKAKVGGTRYDTKVGAVWKACFDPLYRILRVQLDKAPDPNLPVASDDVTALGSILLYQFFSVAYRERSVGPGTTWKEEYRTEDVDGKSLRVEGDHELLEFVFDGHRRVAVIHSTVRVPVYTTVSGVTVGGAVNNDVLSEVYVDTGEVRYRESTGDGPLNALAGPFSVNVNVKDLHVVLREVLEDGTLVDPIHTQQ
jgi:hypothetical protein